MDNKIIAEAASKVNKTSHKSYLEAASVLIEAAGEQMKPGESCVIIDDPTYPYAGQKGAIKSVSDNGAYYLVKFSNGTEVNIMSNQVLKA